MGNVSSTAGRGAPGAAFGIQGTIPNKLSRLKEMSTPGWQFLKKVGTFTVLIVVFAFIYQYMISNNPEEWSHPTDENGDSIINGLYVSTVINSTVGYGDYYPFSQRAIIMVVLNILLSWILFSTVLG